MKAAVLVGPETIVVKDVPEPKPGPDEVVIRVKACGICGSDLGLFKSSLGPGVERILGHEFCGDIVEAGSAVENYKAGDRVVVEPSLVCLKCYYCMRHQYSLCPSLSFTGIGIDGAFAEYVKVPAYQLHILPDDVSYEQGALVEPMSVALHGVWKSGLKVGETAAVFGGGSIGLFAMLWAKLAGASTVFATEVAPFRFAAVQKIADVALNPSQVDVVKEIKARTPEGLGPDVVFECSGNTTAEVQAALLVKKAGRVIIMGVPHENASFPFITFLSEFSIAGALAYDSLMGFGEFTTCTEFLNRKRMDASLIPTTKIGLDDIVAEGFQKSLKGEVGKVLVLP
jgi:threonine dehydrogenase-like Zn-dependent dehydrogenase